jgi:hypothetical protein
MACFNTQLAAERKHKRQELLACTEADLGKIAKEVARRTKTPLNPGQIGQKVGRILHRYKMGKHFRVTIDEEGFRYERRADSIERERDLDGIYVIRTSEPEDRLSAADAVRGYKDLAQVERVFRTLKGLDIRVRPIRHRIDRRVRAHIFLCLLAYYVEWHMRRALAPLLFDDEQLAGNRQHRDPVAPARPSASAQQKKRQRVTPEGLPIQSFETLLATLARRCQNRCRLLCDPEAPPFYLLTDSSPLQQRAFELLGLVFPVAGKLNPLETE